MVKRNPFIRKIPNTLKSHDKLHKSPGILDDHATRKVLNTKELNAGMSLINLPFGTMYMHEISNEISITTKDIHVLIDGWTLGDVSGMTSIDGVFEITTSGKYLVTYSISAGSAGANINYEFGIFDGNTELDNGGCYRKFGAINDVGNCGASAIIDCPSGCDLNLRVKNLDGTQNLIIDHATFNVVRVGN
jgi:hypothetical protein